MSLIGYIPKGKQFQSRVLNRISCGWLGLNELGRWGGNEILLTTLFIGCVFPDNILDSGAGRLKIPPWLSCTKIQGEEGTHPQLRISCQRVFQGILEAWLNGKKTAPTGWGGLGNFQSWMQDVIYKIAILMPTCNFRCGFITNWYN